MASSRFALHPIPIDIKTRMIGFWQRLVNGKPDKISSKLYSTLNDSGLGHYWLNQTDVPLHISKSVKLKLTELHSLSWKEEVFESPKCLNYRIFKQDFGYENYFNILPHDLSKSFCHFRSLNHKMPIEWGDFWGLKGMTEYVSCVDCIKLVTSFITCLIVPILKIPERYICQKDLHLDRC